MPNNHVRAAAEGMPAINRRRLLNLTGAGLALAATSATLRKAAAAPIDAAPAEHPDAELFRLDQEMEEVHARMETASEANSTLSDKIEALLPPRPPKWEGPDMTDHLHEMNLDGRLRDMDEIPEPIRAWFKERGEQRAANKALQDAYHAKCEEINREGGMDAAEEAFNAVCSEEWEIGRRIFAVPAHTLEGMVVKIRAGERLGLENLADPSEAYLSIAADIRRLAGVKGEAS
ncbi:hypothetical protein [Mesorhizobium ventifaucium]|uniref:Twin-arginine translocation signal domain-containing protein n=1 Tax=Mesorhizobium ventifaucium TaxID=666020 RepID=A0ABN8JUF5_9HYPH|nr:hypothetical protein [Mesorhizobium ventifaucium]CAH2400526.1 conserved hypothetical protein [Mesorhizobium ventifaucium]